jgi:hypothetical protein
VIRGCFLRERRVHCDGEQKKSKKNHTHRFYPLHGSRDGAHPHLRNVNYTPILYKSQVSSGSGEVLARCHLATGRFWRGVTLPRGVRVRGEGASS